MAPISIWLLSTVILPGWLGPILVRADLQDLIDFMDAVEKRVLNLALQVEEAYHQRCNSTALSDCEGSHYHSCKSELNNASKTCPPWENKRQLKAEECGDGIECGGFVDFTTAAVIVPVTESDDENGNPIDPGVVETICFGSLYEDAMNTQFQDTSALFLAAASVPEAPFLYFGASDGIFRIFPGRPWRDCEFDPRKRPWYLAASTTPKSVVIILDVSGYPREVDFEYVQDTAKAFVEAMGSGDRVSVVFTGDSTEIADVGNATGAEAGLVMDKATNQVQKTLMQIISDRETTTDPSGDEEGAFNLAFDLLENTINANVVDCDVAVVLLTSERNLESIQEIQNITLGRKERIESLTDRTMLFFGYSTGTKLTDEALALECGLGGVWSIMDSSKSDSGVVANVRLFHEAFAFDLGRSIVNDDLTSVATWSEPYPFFQLQESGTTVAAPVFDRTKSPPVFLGVVGIDMLLKAFEEAIKPDPLKDVRKQIEARQQRQCGSRFAFCDLEALRRRSRRFMGVAVEDSRVCDTERECEEGVVAILDRTTCSEETAPLPLVWNNLDGDGVSYTNRTCWPVDTSEGEESGNDVVTQCIPLTVEPTLFPSVGISEETSPAPTLAAVGPATTAAATESDQLSKTVIGGIVGALIVCAVVIFLVLAYLVMMRQKPKSDNVVIDGGTGGVASREVPTEIVQNPEEMSRQLTVDEEGPNDNKGRVYLDDSSL